MKTIPPLPVDRSVFERTGLRLRQTASCLVLIGCLGSAGAGADELQPSAHLSGTLLPHWKQLQETKTVTPVILDTLAVQTQFYHPVTVDFGAGLAALYKQALGKSYNNSDPKADYRKEAPYYYADFSMDFPGRSELWDVKITVKVEGSDTSRTFSLFDIGGKVLFSKTKFNVPLFSDPSSLERDQSPHAPFRRYFLTELNKACRDNKLPAGGVVTIPSTLEITDASGARVATPVDAIKVEYLYRFPDTSFKDNRKEKIPQRPLTTLMTEEDGQRLLEAGGIAKYKDDPAVLKFLSDRNVDLIRRPEESDRSFIIRASRAVEGLVAHGTQGRPDFSGLGAEGVVVLDAVESHP